MLAASHEEEPAAGIDLAAAVKRCAERLRHAASLAAIAADSTEPERGAQYLLDTVDDLTTELRALRAALHSQPH